MWCSCSSGEVSLIAYKGLHQPFTLMNCNSGKALADKLKFHWNSSCGKLYDGFIGVVYWFSGLFFTLWTVTLAIIGCGVTAWKVYMWGSTWWHRFGHWIICLYPATMHVAAHCLLSLYIHMVRPPSNPFLMQFLSNLKSSQPVIKCFPSSWAKWLVMVLSLDLGPVKRFCPNH